MLTKIPTRVSFVCRKSSSILPDIKPVIQNLSVTSSAVGVYTVVYIYGFNFANTGSTIGTSVVNFGSYTNLPVSFYSSQEISFIVPSIIAPIGNYSINVTNLNYPISLTSNSVSYTIT
jgi:hypothetical protein